LADGGSVWDMFLREVKRQNRNGTQVSYLQLVHNEWDGAARAVSSRKSCARCPARGSPAGA